MSSPSSISPSPGDYFDLGDWVACHRTFQPESRPGAPFLQVLVARRLDVPNVLLMAWHPDVGLRGYWYDGLEQALKVGQECSSLNCSAWDLMLTSKGTNPDLQHYDDNATSLQELIQNRRG